MRTKLVAALLLGLCALGPASAYASQDSDIIPPTKVDKLIDPDAMEPIDFSKVEITTLTPADKFVNATTPLVISLAMGSLALVVYSLVQGSRDADGE